MNWLARVVVALLHCSARMLPGDRRAWMRALWTEAEEVPAGWRRLAWLLGGLRLTVREATLRRGLGYPVAFAAAAAVTAWSVWSGPPGDSAVTINRADVVTVALLLAGLPWVIRRVRGPLAGSRSARLLRTGGYAAVLALVLVKAAVERVADAPPNNFDGPARAWTGEVVFLGVMVGYAALILACSARRSPAAPGTVAIGAATGAALGVVAYLLGPLGFPLRFAGRWPASLYDAVLALGALLALCAPALAGLAATRRVDHSRSEVSRMGQGALAGLWTGATAALVVAVLSTATIALLPYDPGLQHWASSHIGQWTPVVSRWTPIYGPRSYLGYVAGNSAFAAGYLVVLLLGPLSGGALGACSGWGAGHAGRSGIRPGLLKRVSG